MIRFTRVSAIAALILCLPAAAQTGPASCPPLLQHTVPRLQDDKPQALCQYAGKVLLVVNTASYCGYTPVSYTHLDVYKRQLFTERSLFRD